VTAEGWNPGIDGTFLCSNGDPRTVGAERLNCLSVLLRGIGVIDHSTSLALCLWP
jgi:hypothetical protein